MSRARTLLARHVPAPARRVARSGTVRLRHRGLTPDDVLFVAFPKSGSTWLRFVLTQVLTGRPADFDSVRVASPQLGEHRRAAAVLPGGGRLVKSHELPHFLGPARPRVLYLVRDGRDVAVSYHAHLRRRGQPVGDLDAFVTGLAAGRVGVFGSWQDHVADWRAARAAGGQASALLRYEDLRTDPVPALLAATDALGLAVDPDAVAAAFADNTPDAMRAKEAGSRFLAAHKATDAAFVGAATSGGWAGRLRPETVARFEAAAGPELLAHGYALATSGAAPTGEDPTTSGPAPVARPAAED